MIGQKLREQKRMGISTVSVVLWRLIKKPVSELCLAHFSLWSWNTSGHKGRQWKWALLYSHCVLPSLGCWIALTRETDGWAPAEQQGCMSWAEACTLAPAIPAAPWILSASTQKPKVRKRRIWTETWFFYCVLRRDRGMRNLRIVLHIL